MHSISYRGFTGHSSSSSSSSLSSLVPPSLKRARYEMPDLAGDLRAAGWSLSDLAQYFADEEGEEASLCRIAEQGEAVLPCFVDNYALGLLDFYKRFVIWSLGLAGSLSVSQINELADVPAAAFESRLCAQCNVSRRSSSALQLKVPDSFSEAALTYSCHISTDGTCSFKSPRYEDERMPLQRAFGDDKILKVDFCANNRDVKCNYRTILDAGINVGLRHYEFLVYKEEKKSKSEQKGMGSPTCYFVCTTSGAANDLSDVHFSRFTCLEQCRAYLMHIHMVPKFPLVNKRLQLVLSKTTKAELRMSELTVRRIEDIPCLDENDQVVRDPTGKALIHTDGTGYISEDLAHLCNRCIAKKRRRAEDNDQDYGVLVQVRLFYKGMAIKGTLLAVKWLPPKTICYRDSMLKVAADPTLSSVPTYDSLEICDTSQRPTTAKLSRYLVSLLTLGGVPDKVFTEAVHRSIEKAQKPLQDIKAALELCRRFGDKAYVAKRMIMAGIPLGDPHLRSLLLSYVRKGFESYAKAKVLFEDTYYLMGSADPTGTLKRNQVAIVLQHGALYRSRVLVYKHPGMHPGDIHVFEATWNTDFEQALGSGRYVILFSTVGKRSVVDEIANSDLDGDMYWICTNEEVISSFRPSPPWQTPPPNFGEVPKVPKHQSKLKDLQISQFLTNLFCPSMAVATAATNWLAHVDSYLSSERTGDAAMKKEEEMLQLVDLYYAALDSEKTGEKVEVPHHLITRRKPHYMCGSGTYRSTSVLGQIFDLVKSTDEVLRLESKGFPDYCPRFRFRNYEEYIGLWRDKYKAYRKEMRSALEKGDSALADAIIANYRKQLHGGPERWSVLEVEKSGDQVFAEACAIYNVVYDHARSIYARLKAGDEENKSWSFSFAWNVAYGPLCDLFPAEGEHAIVHQDVLALL